MVSTARPIALMYQSVSMPGGPAPQRPTLLRHDTSPAALRATIEPKFLRLSSYNIAEVYGLARMLEAQAQKQAEASTYCFPSTTMFPANHNFYRCSGA